MPADHRVNPYAEHFHNGSLYLIGHCHMRKDIRTVVVDQIQKIKLSAEFFAMVPGFSLERYLRHSSRMFTKSWSGSKSAFTRCMTVSTEICVAIDALLWAA